MGDPITSAIGTGLSVIGSVGRLFSMGRANRDLRKLQGQDPTYSANPLANQRLGLAQTLLNAKMPGSAEIERNIFANQANQQGNINRNATDSSQALALGAANLGQTNQAFNQLGIEQAQDYQRRYQNLQGAQEGVINEGDKVFQDQTRRFGDKVQIQGAINKNRQDAWGSLANAGMGLADISASSGNPIAGYSTGNGDGTSFMRRG